MSCGAGATSVGPAANSRKCYRVYGAAATAQGQQRSFATVQRARGGCDPISSLIRSRPATPLKTRWQQSTSKTPIADAGSDIAGNPFYRTWLFHSLLEPGCLLIRKWDAHRHADLIRLETAVGAAICPDNISVYNDVAGRRVHVPAVKIAVKHIHFRIVVNAEGHTN